MAHLHRVVITGMGVVSAIGNNCQDFWQSLQAGISGIRSLVPDSEEWLPDSRGKRSQLIGAEVTGLNLERVANDINTQMMDRFSQLALAATQEALQDAGADFLAQNPNTAVILGTAAGGDATRNLGSYRLYHKGLKPSPLTILKSMSNAATSLVSMTYGFSGPAFTISSACASASHAIGQAVTMIRQGTVAVAVTGGSETLPSYSQYKSWQQLRILSADTCRPFCRDRDGIVLGEGAGILVLESLESALSRKAHIYAEIIGFGMSSGAMDLVKPSNLAMAKAMELAMVDAQICPEKVTYINAHGTGTVINDAMETTALHSCFGKHAAKLAISSTKSMHGHALGASGALELIAAVLAIQNNIIPPTINYTEPDLDCDLDFVPNFARKATIDIALSNSFGFGGLNAVLVLRKFTQKS